MSAWTPYRPADAVPWSLQRVVHLHRRAGFGATWKELQRDLKDGPEAAIDRILLPDSGRSEASQRFERLAATIADAALGSGEINRLKAWWLYRMLKTPDPLAEKLVLMWHNHFATSNVKVDDIGLMRRQNDTFRKYARAPFADLLRSMTQDPALLVWLDADANRREHPNENLSREIMELFTLGVGNYSEDDVKQAARALTGWTVEAGRFRAVEAFHDPEEKTIFGKTGRWNGNDLVRLLLEHPATAKRLALRITELFMGEGAIDEIAIAELADGLRKHDLDVGWAVETVLRSEAFFADRNIGNRVRGPVEHLVGIVRALEMTDPPPSTLVLAEWNKTLGQDLFYPPNVFGWPGGRSWLTSRALIGRANLASTIVAGGLHHPSKPFDVAAFARRHDESRPPDLGAFCASLILGDPNRVETTSDPGRTPEQLLTSILSSPQAQLG